MSRNFFYLDRSRSISARADVVQDLEYVPVVCPANPGHGRTWRRPGTIVIDGHESDMTPCLWTFFSDCLLEESAITELRADGLTGLVTYPVEVRHRDANPYQYCQIRPVGWGGMASRASGIRLNRMYECCGHRRYSALKDPSSLIDPSQWDGSDFFLVWPLPMFIFVSDRAFDTLSAMRLAGLEMRHIGEFESGKTGFTPGRLEHYLPGPQAAELAQALGID